MIRQARHWVGAMAQGLVGLGLAAGLAAQAAGTETETDSRLGSAPLQTTVGAQQTPWNASATTGDPSPGAEPTRADAPRATDGDPQPLSSLAAVGTDYRIAPNDLIEFDIFGVPDMKRSVRVNASGVISLPLIGPVQVVGLTGQQAETQIAERYQERYLQNPQVSVFIKEFTTQRIAIEGAVLKPGIYPVTGQLSLLRALALAGGYAQYAELAEIMLYRSVNGERLSQTFDLEKIRSGEQIDPEVLPDDVIVVKRNPRRTALRDSIFRDIMDTINPFSK